MVRQHAGCAGRINRWVEWEAAVALLNLVLANMRGEGWRRPPPPPSAAPPPLVFLRKGVQARARRALRAGRIPSRRGACPPTLSRIPHKAGARRPDPRRHRQGKMPCVREKPVFNSIKSLPNLERGRLRASRVRPGRRDPGESGVTQPRKCRQSPASAIVATVPSHLNAGGNIAVPHGWGRFIPVVYGHAVSAGALRAIEGLIGTPDKFHARCERVHHR